MATWVVGVVINILGSITIALGTNLMKVGHSMCECTQAQRILETGRDEPIPRLLTSPRQWWNFRGCKLWSAGTFLFLAGNVANFGSLAFAAQSLIAALGSVQLIANLFLSRWVSREPVSVRIWAATAIIVVGGVLLVAFGNHESPTYTVADLLSFYSGASYIAYMCVGGVACITSYALFLHGKRRILAERAAGSACTVARARWQRWMPFLFSMYAALLGTQSVIYGKTLAILLRTTLTGDSQIGNWYTWVSILVFTISAVWWGTRYNQALKLFPVSLIYPVLMTVWLVTSVVAGSMYYQEYKAMSVLALAMFGGGMAILLVGMFVLSEEAARTAQVYPSTSDLEKQLVEEGDGGVYENDEADGHGRRLPSGSTTFDNELFIEALAKKEAKIDFINPLASGSPSPTKQALRPAGVPDSLLGTADVHTGSGSVRGSHAGTLPGSAAGCGDAGSMPPRPLSVQRSVEPRDTDAAELFTGAHSTTLANAGSSPQRLASRRPSALTVVEDSGATEDPQPSLMHDLAQDFGFGDILQSVRRGLRGSNSASTPFPVFSSVFSMPQPSLPSSRAASVTHGGGWRGGTAGSGPPSRPSLRSNSVLGPRPPHHCLVGSALEGSPSSTRQVFAEAKARAALDGVLGQLPRAPGHHKLQRSMSAVHLPPDLELSDIVIKSGRPNEAGAGPEGSLSLRLTQQPAGGVEVSSYSASALELQGSGAFSITEEAVAVTGATAALQAAAIAAEQQQQLPVPLPHEVLLPAPGSARRPWSLQAQRGTPGTPRLSRLNMSSTAEQPADECSTGGSSQAPKDGLVSPGAFLEGSLSPMSERAARDLAELLQQAQQRHSKAE